MAYTDLELTDKEVTLLDESKKLFPEAVSDVEAVDLSMQKAHRDAMATTKDEVELFQELSYRYARLERLYKKLVAKMPVEG